jgi:signal transduction histidine kinase
VDGRCLPVGLRRRFGVSSNTVVATVLFLLALATLRMGPQGTDAWGPGGVAIAATISSLLLAIPRRPLSALGVMIGVFVVSEAAYGLVPVFALSVIAAVFTVAEGEMASRRAAVGAGVVVAIVLDAGVGLTAHGSWTDSVSVVMATVALGAVAAGDAVRSRRDYTRAIEDRAQRAERALEQGVAKRIAEERLSIARDVHDVVAHHLAVIKVQADVVSHLIETQPVVAKEAAEQVKTTAGSALAELGGLIGVLRRTGPGSDPSVEPPPTLAQLPQLMAAFGATGLDITCRQQGLVRPLPRAVDLAAYRLVQESLTNAHKHGAGDAELRITFTEDEIVIDVANTTATNPAPADRRPGNGLVGMRERIAAVDGRLTLDDNHPGRFRLQAVLPTPAVADDRP